MTALPDNVAPLYWSGASTMVVVHHKKVQPQPFGVRCGNKSFWENPLLVPNSFLVSSEHVQRSGAESNHQRI